MTHIVHVVPEFQEGDGVVLAAGTYQGRSGTFLRLREDVKWADVAERGGITRRHPVAWLAHSNVTSVAAQ